MFIIIGKVEGEPDQYYGRAAGGHQVWTDKFEHVTQFFPDEMSALGEFDQIARSMELYHGGDPDMSLDKGANSASINIPLHIFHLLKLNNEPGPMHKVEGTANIFVCEVKIEPTQYFLSIQGRHPAEGKA